ncbi:MAG: HD domain-containing protein [Saprospiraceae bacterium]|nr:HD domain-containing protein [Saprospiraceae bacterium]
MSKKKIFNDPVYGFISVPYGILFKLVEHPIFQRLRRIKQLSLTHYVYPGALHTRFHHALGALHLMRQAIRTLQEKGVEITDEEAEAVQIAILLHDVGHGPFSHTLEHTLINVTHEELSTWFMEQLNGEFDGALSMAISIFQNQYPKHFLHQLVSGQLDMDRMDYLTRDSFFTGVYEGVIGYDRIIKMLSVKNDELVVEEKGIYSIEKFLIARRLMYWQVYLHKTVLSAEQMLVRTLQRAKTLARAGQAVEASKSLHYFLHFDLEGDELNQEKNTLLQHFASLDDFDVVAALKAWQHSEDEILSYLATSLINRKLFKLVFQKEAPTGLQLSALQKGIQAQFPGIGDADQYFLIKGKETNRTYSTAKEEIKVLLKNEEVQPLSKISDYEIQNKIVAKNFLCYPKKVV